MVEDKGTNLYSLVISQYEKNNTIHYTLRVYATCPFTLNKISEPYNQQYEKQVSSVSQFSVESVASCPASEVLSSVSGQLSKVRGS